MTYVRLGTTAATFDSELKMGTPALKRVRDDALLLSEPERAELAHDLVLSLDGPVDLDAAGEWDAEIQRRIAEIEAGNATLIDRAEFELRMRERSSRR